MRLKKLIVQGFKSFADRTEFVFDCSITGIVGPNGCGKSNVVDAFKWVLGEQSAKSLRGDAMMDVIFNGSGGRKPAGMAEVVLVFSNSKREDGTRLLTVDTDEVAVGRRLFRDGGSEYQINKQSSRLKDVRELFLDTGVGVDAYSVIEQGRVAALLESNPQERRVIFEEAAGISKFKARKKETQRKLEKVTQNLLRVNDIVEEVEKRLRSVKVQAGRARTYQEHAARLAELRLQYALQEYHQHHGRLAELDRQREDAQFRLDDLSGDLAQRQNELAARRQEQEALASVKQRAEYDLVQARAAVQSAQQRQHYARQQLGQIAEQAGQFERDRAALEEKATASAASLAEESAALARLTEELSSQRQLIDDRQGSFRDGELQLNQLNRQIEQQKSALLDLMRKLAQTNSAIGAADIERKNIAAQQTRIAERRRVVVGEVEALEAQKAELADKQQTVLATITGLQARLETCRGEAAQLGKQIASIGEQLGAAKEHRSGLMSRRKLLEDLEARREGVSEGVKSVLRQRGEKFSFIRGLVADVLRVDVEHARVIEAALDGRDQWLIAHDSAAVHAAREVMEELEGRVNVLCVDELAATAADFSPSPGTPGEGRGEGSEQPAAPVDSARDGVNPHPSPLPEYRARETAPALPMPRSARATSDYDWNVHGHGIRLAVDLVRFEPADAPIAMHLLGRTIVVDDLGVAADLRRNGPRGFRFVTPAGEVLEADGTLRAGPLTAAMGLLSRRSELDALAFQIADVDTRIAALTVRLTEGNSQAKSLEESQNAIRNEMYSANTTKVELTSALAQNGDKQNALRREQPILERELQGFVDQLDKLQLRQAALAQDAQKFEADQVVGQEAVRELTARQQETAENLRRWGEELTASRVQHGQVQEKQLAAQQQVQRLTAAGAELGQQIERVEKSAHALAGRTAAVEKELQAAEAAEAQLGQQQTTLGEKLATLTGQLQAVVQAAEMLGGQVETIRADHGELESSLHALQLQSSELRVRLETLISRTAEELQLDLPAKYAEFSNPVPNGAAPDAVAVLADDAAAPTDAVAAVAGAADGGIATTETGVADSVPAGVTRQATAAPVGYQPADIDWDAVAAEIKELREKIHRLGNVNLDAIGELDELEQRSNFLTTQVTDLTTSRQQLEELIQTINVESSARFETTFNTVREHFQVMFRKLFGGGKADVFLETEIDELPAAGQELGPDGQTLLPVTRKIDVLDAGIEIIAHPPGKKPVSISQLSGGEKTMTCVALLMSIFKSKPSPFCILDEVDAALDEANNQRFNMIVQEFLAQSQFIVITHSKRTMQIAEMLYGVTMQEQGVSKRVSVKFDQVDGQGRITTDEAEPAAA